MDELKKLSIETQISLAYKTHNGYVIIFNDEFIYELYMNKIICIGKCYSNLISNKLGLGKYYYPITTKNLPIHIFTHLDLLMCKSLIGVAGKFKVKFYSSWSPESYTSYFQN